MSININIEEGIDRLKIDKIESQLCNAALKGDWNTAESIYNKDTAKSIDNNDEEGYNAVITSNGETALHIAALAGHMHFVKQLVDKMTEEGLAMTTETKMIQGNTNTQSISEAMTEEGLAMTTKTKMIQGNTETESTSEAQALRVENGGDDHRKKKGNTAFHYAAVSGRVEVAKILQEKCPDLTMTRGLNDTLPIYMAAVNGHWDMVMHLYESTRWNAQFVYNDRMDLLLALIDNDIYDIALLMVDDFPELAMIPDSKKETALHALARKSLNPPDGALKLVKLLGKILLKYGDPQISDLFEFVKHGNVKFLSVLTRLYPQCFFISCDDNHTIFHKAVLYRCVDVFKTIHKGPFKTFATSLMDENGNNMLHLAGKLPPPSRLNVVPGAALQLQRELLWFEEVKKVVGKQQYQRNKDNKTPRDIFEKEHGILMKDGEQWMRDTANSCMIVATLITTVVFAAAFTIPGGNRDDGIPIFQSENSFKVFIIFDTISLITSASSVLSFLSILTSRYTMDDFLFKLPNKLVFGIVLLFLSITTMMGTFVAALFLLSKNGKLPFTIPIVVFACLPIILFIYQHFHLLFDVIRSTYMSRSLFKPNKNDIHFLHEA